MFLGGEGLFLTTLTVQVVYSNNARSGHGRGNLKYYQNQFVQMIKHRENLPPFDLEGTFWLKSHYGKLMMEGGV